MTRQAWLSFIPYHTARDLADHPHRSPIGREQRFQAVTLFADVSGFTAISEALGKAGKGGTEELTRILNSYFEPMIALIESYGGIVGKFGGDAMTVLFPYQPQPKTQGPREPHPPTPSPLAERGSKDRSIGDGIVEPSPSDEQKPLSAGDVLISRGSGLGWGSQREVARRATRCALDMQRDMTRYAAISTSAGTFGLAMKAGLALGSVYCTNVGDPDGRIEFIIADEAIDACSEAEHHAEKGEVVVQDTLLPLLDGLEWLESREGFTLVAGDLPDAAPAPLATLPDFPETMLSVVSRYIPPTVAARLESGREEFIDEHRRVTVLFVSFANLDYENESEVGDLLRRYLAQVVSIIARYDGTLNKVDMGDKGSKYIVLFGAPIAHEDDERRALRCALELNAIPDMPLRIGVNTGLVYCGRVGSSARREYTVMGDGVNLSARLMQYAQPGQIIVSDMTYASAAGDFEWTALQPIMVKGKSAPITIFQLRGLKAADSSALREPTYKLPMVGRARELDTADDKLLLAASGEGQILGIVAEAGMGKSRLVAEIVKAARGHGMAVYGGACTSYNTDLGYVVWGDVWRGLFGLDPTQSAERQIEALETALRDIDPAFVLRLPLVGPVVGLNIRDNDMTASLDPALRSELLHGLLLTCLQHYTKSQSPIMIVLEDCHWIDGQSRALAEYLGRNLARLPVMLLMAYRPPVDEHLDRDFAFMLPAMRFAHFTELRLGRFNREETSVLVALKLAQAFGYTDALPDGLIDRVVERSEGNPFYIDELMNLLHDQNVDPQDAAALESLALPDSLHSLILSRIDRLTENEQVILKVASVIGRIFKASWIPGSYPEVGATPEVFMRLGRLSDLELTPLDRPEPELEYLFKHLTTQEVAYESMAFATRENLHERVGLFIESRFGALDDYVHLLAFHFGRTRDADRQRRYFRLAGDAAKTAYANAAALRYYRDLYPLLEHDPAAQTDLLLNIGAVQQITGEWDDAENAFREALTQAESSGDQLRTAQTRVALGDLLSYGGSLDEAIALLEAAHADFAHLEYEPGLSRALRHLSYVHFRQGDYDRARDFALQQLQITDEPRAVADAHHNLGLIDWYTGNLDGALTHFEKAKAYAERAGHQQAVIYALNNISGLYFTQEDYSQAMRYAREVLDLASEIGYVRVMGVVLGNLGSLYLESGHEDEALPCYEASLRVALEIGDRMAAPMTLRNLALAYFRRGDLDTADGLLSRAFALAKTQDTPDLLCDCAYDLLQLRAAQGRYAEALDALDAALQYAEALGGAEGSRADVIDQATVLRPLLRVKHGEWTTDDAINVLRDYLEADNSDSHRALIFYQLWTLNPADDTSRQQAADLYRQFYAESPQANVARRYTELTQERLPGVVLPAPPPAALRNRLSLDVLLAHFDATMAV